MPLPTRLRINAPSSRSARGLLKRVSTQVIGFVGIKSHASGGDDSHGLKSGSTQKLHGVRVKIAEDRYYNLITARWGSLMLACAVLYFGMTLVFAVAVYYDSDAEGGVSQLGAADTMGRFGDAWFFSMQALSTIGFGSLSPRTSDTNIVTNVEACFGIFLIAIINGVVWGKFVTIGQASAVFSRHAVMMLPEDEENKDSEAGGSEGGALAQSKEWELVFRIANNQRGQSLVHVKVQAFAVIPAFSPGGSRILRQEPMELDRAYYPMLVVNGEVSCRAKSRVDCGACSLSALT